MRAATAILALAGSALAAPHWSQPEVKEVQNVHVVYETVLHTVYYTEGQEQAKPTKARPVYHAPAVTTTVVYEASAPTSTEVYEAPAPTSTEVYEAPAPTSTEVYEAPAPTSTEVYEAPAPTSTEVYEAPAPPAPTSSKAPAAPAPSAPASGYQAVVDTWRAKMGMKPLVSDKKLISNAMDTVVSSNGQMVHKLNPGSFGQVLAPGNEKDFEHVFVGGWLCEIPTLPGLDGVCSTQSDGWSYEGQTGHAEILTSDNYSKIGCALHQGIWCCDLA